MSDDEPDELLDDVPLSVSDDVSDDEVFPLLYFCTGLEIVTVGKLQQSDTIILPSASRLPSSPNGFTGICLDTLLAIALFAAKDLPVTTLEAYLPFAGLEDTLLR